MIEARRWPHLTSDITSRPLDLSQLPEVIRGFGVTLIDLTWPNLRFVGFLEVLRPDMCFISQVDLLTMFLDPSRCKSGPLVQFTPCVFPVRMMFSSGMPYVTNI